MFEEREKTFSVLSLSLSLSLALSSFLPPDSLAKRQKQIQHPFITSTHWVQSDWPPLAVCLRCQTETVIEPSTKCLRLNQTGNKENLLEMVMRVRLQRVQISLSLLYSCPRAMCIHRVIGSRASIMDTGSSKDES